ncbi:hypothetical protein AB0442_20810 [Kitasatospora sp. NPDC085895]|uniref:hypothetical protein n=1 Tax=Kitasatospora sp. NPDC085895 TaxID=3155057 RepID=UPI00344E7C1C
MGDVVDDPVDDPVEALCVRLHRGLRGEGPLAAADAAALGCALLDLGHQGPTVREAVERRPADVPPADAADLAARLLAEAGFEPGFDLVPERLETLRRALEPVLRDLPGAGGPGARLVVQDAWYPPSAGVVLADGRLHGGGLPVCAGGDPVTAVAAVAAHVQESLMERDRRALPLCPDHGLGLHAVRHSDAAVWWCAADGGHPAAAIGRLPRTGRNRDDRPGRRA